MKWILQNFGERMQFALRNPGYALRSLYGEITHADERFLSTITGVSARKVRTFLGEPINTPEFAARLREVETEFQGLEIRSADIYAKKMLLQYIAIRALQPDIIVETGVANGVSSAYFLLALHKNKHGTLHSIGLDDARFLPDRKSLGWIVPDFLKPRWNLLIGDSRHLLPALLARLGEIDVFVHDSMHTYDHMLWEYRTAFPFVRAGGLLLSDDAAWNPAFPEFCRESDVERWDILRGVGFLQKNHDSSAERGEPATMTEPAIGA